MFYWEISINFVLVDFIQIDYFFMFLSSHAEFKPDTAIVTYFGHI